MEILFLGTCACDYSPRLKTDLADRFDDDARRSSSMLIDGRYLVDCGDHTLDSLRIAEIDPRGITDVFITHLHHDHYNASHIEKIALAASRRLRVWVRADASVPHVENADMIKMAVGKKYRVTDGFDVTGLAANHDAAACPHHFLFEKDGKKLMYACDGGWFLNSTWYAMKKLDLDLFVMDATCGDYLGDFRIGEHNTLPMIFVMLPSLKKWGTVSEKTKIYLSHLAPSLHAPHKETEQLVAPHGLTVARDGLKIEI